MIKENPHMVKDFHKQDASPLLFEGMVSLRALIDAPKSSFNDRRIQKVLYAKERLEKQKKEYAFLCHRAEEQNFEIILSEKAALNVLASGSSHGGVLALCTKRRYRIFSEDDLPEKGFFVMTEGIEDPYNFGYALRSIYAAGADAVILTGGVRTGADGIVCRSSAGASERLPIYTGIPAACADILKHAGYKIICANLPGSLPVYDADLKKPLLLVIGGEKRGISGDLLKKSDAVVRLDYGRAFDASLSAASAASILAFEVFRQNR